MSKKVMSTHPLRISMQFFADGSVRERIEQIEARMAVISTDLETRSAELNADDLSAYETEVQTLQEERRAIREKEEKRQAIRDAIGAGQTPSRVMDSFMPEQRGGGTEVDPYDTVEYRNAFMQFCKDGTPIPAELRATTTTTDVQAVIPTTTLNEIVRELKAYGGLFAEVRKLNIQGGVEIPILSLKPKASWVGETTPSADQKLTANTKVSFNYYGLECKISQSLIANVATYSTFQELFVPLAVEAMNEALDIAIISGDGSGKMLGVTKDTRVVAAQKITLTDADFTSWSAWKKKVFAKMKLKYRTGKFYMAAGTFDGYVDGMVDTNGQPIGRVNYGIADGPTQRFGGRPVELVEDNVITSYDSAGAGDVVAVFFDPKDYGVNSNMQMQVVRWTDHDTNEVKDKAIMVCDGKLIDPAGVLIILKGTTSGG